MIYESLLADDPLTQGEIIDGCPLLTWTTAEDGSFEPVQLCERVIILTQACDLESPAKKRVTVAVTHTTSSLVEQGTLKSGTIRDSVRTHRMFGWYFLPAGERLPESIIDLHDLYTVPRALLEQLAASGSRVCRMTTPYREHLSQHFAVTYSRIGLPEPYATE